MKVYKLGGTKMTAVYVVSAIIIVVVFGAFVVTVNKGYGVKHKVDKLDDIKLKHKHNHNDNK
jgi:hypothetical protein